MLTWSSTEPAPASEIPQALAENCTFGENWTLSETLKPGFSDEELSQKFFDSVTALYYYGYRFEVLGSALKNKDCK